MLTPHLQKHLDILEYGRILVAVPTCLPMFSSITQNGKSSSKPSIFGFPICLFSLLPHRLKKRHQQIDEALMNRHIDRCWLLGTSSECALSKHGHSAHGRHHAYLLHIGSTPGFPVALLHKQYVSILHTCHTAYQRKDHQMIMMY